MRVDHISRAMVPWHEPATMTECGRPVDDVASLITRAELVEKIEQEGAQRALYSSCQTCLSTAGRYPTWDVDPIAVIERHFAGMKWRSTPEMKQEVLAIASLVTAHRDEFDELQRDFAATTDLSSVRKRRGRLA